MLVDVKALNIPRQRDVVLNELARQMLLVLLLLLLQVLTYVRTIDIESGEGVAPPCR